MSDNNRQAVLRFDRVTVTFGDVEALSSVSFEAFEGESRVILGAAGSGKTVLLKTALGLVKPDSGAVYAFGENLTTLSERQLFDIRSKIGMLFQEGALFDSLNIRENVAYPLLNQRSIHCAPEQFGQPRPPRRRGELLASSVFFVSSCLGGGSPSRPPQSPNHQITKSVNSSVPPRCIFSPSHAVLNCG